MTESIQALDSKQPVPGWYGVDPSHCDLKGNPHALYRGLRENQPINLTPDGLWRLTRYHDIQKLLKRSSVGMRTLDGLIPNHTREESDASRFMLRTDPPDHDRLRSLVSKAFTPSALAAIRPQVQAAIDEELARFSSAGSMDLVEHLALPVPAASMCAMLGVPFEDRNRLSELVSWATYLLAAKAYPELVPRANAAINELAVYMLALFEERRRNPGTDILTALVLAEEQGDRLDDEELLQQSIGLLIAGLETTIGLIGNGMRAFAHNPDQFELLAQQPELASRAVEECLRYEPSVPSSIRVVWEDTEFDGYVIPRDSAVMPVLIAGNRDPEVFSDPDRFDISRNEARHCSFGGGIHFCLGSHLARMNAEVAFTSMASRFTKLELDEAGFEWAPSLFRIPGKIPAGFQIREP
jgi:cytochrome P450